ncbi:ATP-binding cassette domain-containing protein [Xylanimonas cellulosilytica]|uniref:ATP-binding cassette domain-containing protein n=1 Tax=Xylanimonas cellulosilytica TaxID=186189 RepID=UPI001FE13793|nr:ATP-binding cassette domain-containing protein [Xylanimonas cellulosilytica]
MAGVNLRVTAGVRLGVVGENGSGKSTLLHLLAGTLTPTAGEVRRSGTVAVVEQELLPARGETVGDVVRTALAGVRQVAADLDAAAAAFAETAQEGHDDAALTELATLLTRADHLAAWDADRRVDEALTRLGAPRDLDRTLETLSIGQRYRVRLACRLAERSDFLLLDEPTNHLDDEAIGFLTDELLAWRGGVVLVTHDRQLLDDVATAIYDLDPSIDGRPVLYGQPGYLAYRFAKTQALHRWRQRYRAERKRAEKLAERLDASYEGLSDEWRPPKGSQKHRRSTRARIHVKAADRLVQRLEADAVEVPVPPLELRFPDLPTLNPGWDPAQPLIEVRNPRVLGDPVVEPVETTSPVVEPLPVVEPVETTSPVVEPLPVVEPVETTQHSQHGVVSTGSTTGGAGGVVSTGSTTGEPGGNVRLDLPGVRVAVPAAGRLLVVGPNGSGKSTLLGVLAGRLPLARGSRVAVDGLRVGVVGQENAEIIGRGLDDPRTLTGFDAAANEALALLSRGALDPDHVVPVAALGLLAEEDLDRPLAELSAGQRRRFELARTLLAAPHLLVLDEPTNHLSIDLVDELTRALDRTSAAVVVATHDRRMREDLAHWPTLELD